MTLNELLQGAGIELESTMVFRHSFQKRLPKLHAVIEQIIADEPDVFDAWQQFHAPRTERNLEKSRYVASFIADGPGRALFVGLYENHGSTPVTKRELEEWPNWRRLREFPDSKKDDDRDSLLHFDLQLSNHLSEHRGRLVIEWDNAISWARWAAKNEFAVLNGYTHSKFVGAVVADIQDVSADRTIEETERNALIAARIGQGQFRSDLMKVWNCCCAVTGCGITGVLRASHIMPWKDSNHSQRLNVNNGLLLIANLDAAFDRGLITFGDNGRMIVSDDVSADDRQSLGLSDELQLSQEPGHEMQAFLAWHRENHFRKHK